MQKLVKRTRQLPLRDVHLRLEEVKGRREERKLTVVNSKELDK